MLVESINLDSIKLCSIPDLHDLNLRIKQLRIKYHDLEKSDSTFVNIDWKVLNKSENILVEEMTNRGIEVKKVIVENDSGYPKHEYRSSGIADKDLLESMIANPSDSHDALLDSLNKLGNNVYKEVIAEKPYDDWTLKDVLTYFVRIARAIGFEFNSPKVGTKDYMSPFWQTYRASLKIRVPPEGKVTEITKMPKQLTKQIKVIVKSEDEMICTGIVYEPDIIDSQSDFTDALEISKACYDYIVNARRIHLNHSGKVVKSEILENFIAPVTYDIVSPDGTITTVKKGGWILSLRIKDQQIWEKIKAGELNGLSMAGIASY